MSTTIAPSPPFLLKTSPYTLTVLQILSTDLSLLSQQIAEKVKQAPAFFKQLPILLDLHAIAENSSPLDFEKLFQILRAAHLIPIGVRNGSAVHHEQVAHLGHAIFSEKVSHTPPPAPTPKEHFSSMVVMQPVRSGQQVHSKDGDLIICGAISAGAELLATGNIHVYGPLRGRALAGIKGNTQARIFCQSLEAELVAIAGQYCVNEDLQKSHWGKPVCIELQAGHLQITPLS